MDLSKLKGKKILIVEDDETNSELIKEIFYEADVILIRVISGVDAVNICHKEDFNLILMDIQLPEKNGFDATTEIKKFKPDIPVIAQTAYAFESDKQKAIEAGCSDYIAKPFRKDELLNMVIKYIN